MKELNVRIVQFCFSNNLEENFSKIKNEIENDNFSDILILPECCLSGYEENLIDMEKLNNDQINYYRTKIKNICVDRNKNIIYGSFTKIENKWYNSAILVNSAEDIECVYNKNNLAINERGIISPGFEFNIISLIIRGITFKIGIQICREIRFPEQWKLLAKKGADFFVYITNAKNGSSPDVWRAHLVSRAAEMQRYILSCNIADEIQQCPTMIVNPEGVIEKEFLSKNREVIDHTIDLSNLKNWYLDQTLLTIE